MDIGIILLIVFLQGIVINYDGKKFNCYKNGLTLVCGVSTGMIH